MPEPRTPVPPKTLSPKVLTELRKPFELEAVRFKIQTTSGDETSALAVFYMDARMVAARLDAVVGPAAWSDSYVPLMVDNPAAFGAAFFPVECSLTVLGVTKVDVGVYQKNKADQNAVKSSYSDALKRAAVKFGVGAYLYALPKVWADTKVGRNGKAVGFSAAGEAKLRQAYTAWLGSGQPFGPAFKHGFALVDPDDAGDVAPEPSGGASAATGATDPVDAPPAGGKPAQAVSQPRLINQEQRSRLWATAGELGLSQEQVRYIIAIVVNDRAAVESTANIPVVRYDKVMEGLAVFAKDMDEGGTRYVDARDKWRELNPELALVMDQVIELNKPAVAS